MSYLIESLGGYPTPPKSPFDEQEVCNQPLFTVIASSRVVIAGRVTAATIVSSVETGKITSIIDTILPRSSFPEGVLYQDCSPHIILPGLVDAHVHLNEPGRTEWEGFFTGTQAAAFGGVTTVIDMPLNAIPPTITVDALKEKILAAQDKCWVDVGFYGGIVPGNCGELRALVRQGVRGFKAFLIDSGVEEFPAVGARDIAKAFRELANDPTIVMFHAEVAPHASKRIDLQGEARRQMVPPVGPVNEYRTFLQSRPPMMEKQAIEKIVALSHIAPELPLHIVHLSAIESIPSLRAARASGVKVTAETCPHYLSLMAEEVRPGDTRYKCCPPIRASSNKDRLWEEMLRHDQDGVIQTVVSDHSPCTPDIKLLPSHITCSSHKGLAMEEFAGTDETLGNFFEAWGGISSVGLSLPILWSEMNRRGLTSPDQKETAIVNVVKWCCTNTARQVGLQESKGEIRIGTDADFCVFDDTAEWVVENSALLFRNKGSLYEATKMTGMVKETWLRARRIFVRGTENAGFGDGKCIGKLLLQPRVRGSSPVEQYSKTE